MALPPDPEIAHTGRAPTAAAERDAEEMREVAKKVGIEDSRMVPSTGIIVIRRICCTGARSISSEYQGSQRRYSFSRTEEFYLCA